MPVADEVSFEALDLDPYPIYARLRREDPIAYFPQMDAWMVTRWEDCQTVAGDSERFGGATNHPTTHRVFGEPNILTADGDVHKELRASVDPHYRPRQVNTYVEGLTRPIARAQVAAIVQRDDVELVNDFLEPISVLALAAVLGIPGLDAETLQRWFHDLITGSANEEQDPAKYAISDAASAEIEARLDPLLEELAVQPNDSAISHMLHDGMPPGQVRSREWIYPSLKVIIAGGMQEPGHGAASTMLGLLENPDQLARVVADGTLIPKAISEGLRWIAPIGHCERQAFEDAEVAGVTIPAGQAINVMLASANRDETIFDRPDDFDIDRKEKGHLAFGAGTHFCSGHYFARQVERIALEELLEAFPKMRLDEDREVVVRGWVFRAPRKLPVRLHG